MRVLYAGYQAMQREKKHAQRDAQSGRAGGHASKRGMKPSRRQQLAKFNDRIQGDADADASA